MFIGRAMDSGSGARRHRWIPAGVVLLVGFHAILLMASPAFGPADDYVLLATLQSGKPLPFVGKDFPLYDDARLGRFVPLIGQDYNLVAFFSATPRAYYCFNAIQLVLWMALTWRILRGATADVRGAAVAILVVLLSPGLANAWFGLISGNAERGAILCLTLFLLCHLRMARTGSVPAAGFMLVFANLALYFKEPVFLALSGYSAGHLILGWKTSSRLIKVADALVLASSAIYLLLYLLLVRSNHGELLYGHSPLSAGLVFLKNGLNYALVSDPVVVLLAYPLAAGRLFRICRRQEPGDPVFDSMLFGGCLYTGAFFLLKLYQPYYFLPAYVFLMPALVRSFPVPFLLPRWRLLPGIATAVLLLNSIPSALHDLAFNNYHPDNFEKTVDFLASDIRAGGRGQQRKVFLDGIPRGRDADIFLVYGEFLRYRGLTASEFDVESSLARTSPLGPVVIREKYLSQYGAYREGPPPEPMAGDYLVVSPYDLLGNGPERLNQLERDYRLVFSTSSRLAVPPFTVKALVKKPLMKLLSAETKSRWGLDLSGSPPRPPDFHVLIRK